MKRMLGLTLLNRLITSTHGQMKLDGCRQTGRFALMWSVARPDGMAHTDPRVEKNQDSVAVSVNQASVMVLFEDALEAGTLGVDIWSAPSIRTTPVVNLAP